MPVSSPPPAGSTARTNIAVNVRRFRKERNLSQEKLGELAQCHRTYVSQLERGVTNISVDRLERLAGGLNVTVVDLMNAPDERE